MLALFEELAWRLAAASLPVDRLSLHIGTLHPQIIGFGWNWSRDDGLCDEIKVGEGALDSDAYRLSPLARCIEHGERFRADPRDAALQARFPFLAELAGHGFTEYAALPLGGDGYHNVMTVATKAPGGVTEADLQALMGLRKIFALHVQRHIALRIAGNVLGTYLGAAAGARVLDGSIRRGSGEAISAVDHGLGPARLHGPVGTPRRPGHDRPAQCLFRAHGRRRPCRERRGAEVHRRRASRRVSVRRFRRAGGGGIALRWPRRARRSPPSRRSTQRPGRSTALPAGGRCAPASPCTPARSSSAISAPRSGSTSRSSAAPSTRPAASRACASRSAARCS